MVENSKKKNNQYLVTMRWYVETDEELQPGGKESDEIILDIVRRRTKGTSSCKSCPTRNFENYAILKHHDFMGDKPIYMSTEKIVVDEEEK